ncbi:SAM-dependent methyltransferase [Anaerobacillus isosaccharinicus]|uniref:SAM-dependent methyltransferase n=1 Tax=Anaerobacillus isosaccharinicus TaxID=1532552 RepID=A0A1S2KX92_9BACI|nr:SAM-dependent methyltransferase [Anaerobacillus isosaccharinicus]MBA5586866.1 SAM-dependent methyltransferase [Anaerobacillus isosaccharinicus]QOY34923.1 SAM-dependent methyltransferase [Anaerobacillus isosaccharinicus]
MIELKPIGIVYNDRCKIEDDNWGDVISKIILDVSLPVEALSEIDSFSHLDIIFYFHKVEKTKIISGARHPRNNETLPKVGIFAQRGKNRPNQLGLTTVRLLKREGRELVVLGLDCINETPILDIKPVMKEFLPKEKVIQPDWSLEIMKNYWD